MEEYYIVMRPGEQPLPMQIIDGEPRLLDQDDIILRNGPMPSGTGTSVHVVDEFGVKIDGFISTEAYYYIDDDGHCMEIPPGSICTGEFFDTDDDEDYEEREMSDNIKSLSIALTSVSDNITSALMSRSSITPTVAFSSAGTGPWSAQRNGTMEECDAGGFGVDGEIYGTIISLPETEDLPASDTQYMSSSSQPTEYDNYVASTDENPNLLISEVCVETDYVPVTVSEHVVDDNVDDNCPVNPDTIECGFGTYVPVVINDAPVVTEEIFTYAPDYGEDMIRDAPDVTVTDFIETELTEEISVGLDSADLYFPSSSRSEYHDRTSSSSRSVPSYCQAKTRKIKSPTVSLPASTQYFPSEKPTNIPKTLPPSKLSPSVSKKGPLLKSPLLKPTTSSVSKVTKSSKVLSTHASEKKTPSFVSSTARHTQPASKQKSSSSTTPPSAPPTRDPNVRASGRARRANTRFDEFECTGDRSTSHFSGSGGDSESDTSAAGRERKLSSYETFQKLIADAKVMPDSQCKVKGDKEPRQRRNSKKSDVSKEEYFSAIDRTTTGDAISRNNTSAVDATTDNKLTVDDTSGNPSNEELQINHPETCDPMIDVMNLGEGEVVIEETVVIASSTGQQYFHGDEHTPIVSDQRAIDENLMQPEAGLFRGQVKCDERYTPSTYEQLISDNQPGMYVEEIRLKDVYRDACERGVSIIPVTSTDYVTDTALEYSLNTSSDVFSSQRVGGSNAHQLSVDVTESLDSDTLIIDSTPPSRTKRGKPSASTVKRGRGRQSTTKQNKTSESESVSQGELSVSVNVQDMACSEQVISNLNSPPVKTESESLAGSPATVKRGRGRPPKQVTIDGSKVDNSRSNVSEITLNVSSGMGDVSPAKSIYEKTTVFAEKKSEPESMSRFDEIPSGSIEICEVNTLLESSSTIDLKHPYTVHESTDIDHSKDHSDPAHDGTVEANITILEPATSVVVVSNLPVPAVSDPVALVDIPVEAAASAVTTISSPNMEENRSQKSKRGRRQSRSRKKSCEEPVVNPVSPVFDVLKQTSSTVSDSSVLDQSVASVSKLNEWEESDMKFAEALAEVMETTVAIPHNYCNDSITHSDDATEVLNVKSDASEAGAIQDEGVLNIYDKDVKGVSSEQAYQLITSEQIQDEESKAHLNKEDELSVSIKPAPIIDETSLNKLNKTKRVSKHEEQKQVDLYSISKDLRDTDSSEKIPSLKEIGLKNAEEDDVSMSAQKRRGRSRKSTVPEAAGSITEMKIESKTPHRRSVDLKLKEQSDRKLTQKPTSNVEKASMKKLAPRGGSRKRRQDLYDDDERQDELEKKRMILSHDEERINDETESFHSDMSDHPTERETKLDGKMFKLDSVKNVDVTEDDTECVEPKVDVLLEPASSEPCELVSFGSDKFVSLLSEDVRDEKLSYTNIQTELRVTNALSDREESCDSFTPSGIDFFEYTVHNGAGDSECVTQTLDIESMLSAGVNDPILLLSAIKAIDRECTVLEHSNKALEDKLDAMLRRSRLGSNESEGIDLELENKDSMLCTEDNELFVSSARSVSESAEKKWQALEREYNIRMQGLIVRETRLKEETEQRKEVEEKEGREADEIRDTLEVDLEKWEKTKAKHKSLRKSNEKDTKSEKIQSERKHWRKEKVKEFLTKSDRGDGDKLDEMKTEKIKKERFQRPESSSKSHREKSNEKHSSSRKRESSTVADVHHESKKINRRISETGAQKCLDDGQGFSASSREGQDGSAGNILEGASSSVKYDDEVMKKKNMAGLKALQSLIQMRVQRVAGKDSASEQSEVDIGSDGSRNGSSDVRRNESRPGNTYMGMAESKTSSTDAQCLSKSADKSNPTVNTSAPAELSSADQLPVHFSPHSKDCDVSVICKINSVNEEAIQKSQYIQDGSSTEVSCAETTRVISAENCTMEHTSITTHPQTVTSPAADHHLLSVTDCSIDEESNKMYPITLMSPAKTTLEEAVSSVALLSTSTENITDLNTETITNPSMETITDPNMETITDPNMETITDPNEKNITDPQMENITDPSTENIGELEVSFRSNTMSP